MASKESGERGGLEQNQTDVKIKNKIDTHRLCLIIPIAILLIGLLAIVGGYMADGDKNAEQYTIQNNMSKDKIHEQSETSIRQEATNSNQRVNTQEEINKVEEKNEQLRLEKSDEWSIQVSDLSEPEETKIWTSDIKEVLMNTAVVEDEDLEGLEYDENAGDRLEGETVYSEEEYNVDSETTHHQVTTPVIAFKKAGSLEKRNGITADEVITYEIQLENTGEAVAYNLIVKDTLPKYTDFMQIQKNNQNENIQAEHRYIEQQETIVWTIEKLEPGESATVAFQVKVRAADYENNREIHNTGYIKVVGKTNDLRGRIEDEQGYASSNQIVYAMKQNINIVPATGDDTGDIRGLVIIMGASCALVLLIFLNLRKKGKKNI